MATILIIDDEAPIRNVLAKLLHVKGHEVITTDDGQEAENLIASQPLDLVICDIRMTPIDGLTVLKHVHAAKPGLPVIMLSAYSSDEMIRKSMDAGAHSFLRKTCNLNDLLATIQRALPGESG